MQYLNRLSRKRLIILLVLLLTTVNGLANIDALATDDYASEYIKRLNASSENQGEEVNQSFMNSIVKMIFGLVVVIAVALVTLKLVKKFFMSKKETGWLQVIAYDNIGPNKGVCVAKIGQKSLVLGVTEHNITKLMELSNEEIEELELSLTVEPEGTNNLASFITKGESGNFSFHEHLQDSISKVQSLKQRNQETGKR